VRVALAPTRRWITVLGRVDAAALLHVQEDFTEEERARLTMEAESPLGRISHLQPVAVLSETLARWTRPPVPLGHAQPAWDDTTLPWNPSR